MIYTETATAVRRQTNEALEKSTKQKELARCTLSQMAFSIDQSRRLLTEWYVNGMPALHRLEVVFVESDPAKASEAPAPAVAPDVPHASRATDIEEIVDRDFRSESVRLDGRHFIGCTLDACILDYAGGPVMLESTHFSGCRFRFAEEAAMTVSLLECFNMIEPQGSERATPPADAPRVFARVN